MKNKTISNYYNRKKSLEPDIIYGIIVLIAVFIFIAIICYIRPPIGDDLLCNYKNWLELSGYIDNSQKEQIWERITTLSDVFVETMNYYKLWSGRLFGVFLTHIMGLLNRTTISIISGLVISLIILLANILVYGTLKKALKNPGVMIIFFMSAYYFHYAIDMTIMWTFISQYQITLLLVITYLIFFRKILFSDAESNISKIVLLNCLGFLTGFNQEIFTVSLCAFIAAIYLFESLFYKTKINKLIFTHTGLIAGTVISLIAPGNFNRMMQSHEALILAPWYDKCFMALKHQLLSLAGVHNWYWFMLAIITASLFFIAYSFRKHIKISVMIKNPPRNLVFSCLLFFMLLVSNVLWAITYAKPWHMPFFNLFFLISVFSIIFYINSNYPRTFFLSILKSAGQKITVVLFVLFLTFSNAGWILSNYKTRIEWNKQIKYANDYGLNEIYVPKFEEKYSNRFNFFNRNNNIGDESFEDYEFCIIYYNTKVLPK